MPTKKALKTLVKVPLQLLTLPFIGMVLYLPLIKSVNPEQFEENTIVSLAKNGAKLWGVSMVPSVITGTGIGGIVTGTAIELEVGTRQVAMLSTLTCVGAALAGYLLTEAAFSWAELDRDLMALSHYSESPGLDQERFIQNEEKGLAEVGAIFGFCAAGITSLAFMQLAHIGTSTSEPQSGAAEQATNTLMEQTAPSDQP